MLDRRKQETLHKKILNKSLRIKPNDHRAFDKNKSIIKD